MKNFQVISIVVFIALAIFGVLVFSGLINLGDDSTEGQGTVTLWGTVSGNAINQSIEEFNNANQSFVLKYVQKGSEDFDQDLLEALASGTGPDLVLLPDDLAFHYANKIFAIPYVNYPVATFRQSFAQVGEVFLSGRGVLALPLALDPLVMYYNRSMLDNAGIVNAPQ